jgi:hypothetical protein
VLDRAAPEDERERAGVLRDGEPPRRMIRRREREQAEGAVPGERALRGEAGGDRGVRADLPRGESV